MNEFFFISERKNSNSKVPTSIRGKMLIKTMEIREFREENACAVRTERKINNTFACHHTLRRVDAVMFDACLLFLSLCVCVCAFSFSYFHPSIRCDLLFE